MCNRLQLMFVVSFFFFFYYLCIYLLTDWLLQQSRRNEKRGIRSLQSPFRISSPLGEGEHRNGETTSPHPSNSTKTKGLHFKKQGHGTIGTS